VDTRVDVRQRASAQSFIAFVMLGVGMFVGAIASGKTVDAYPPVIQVKAEVTAKSKTSEVLLPLPEWDAAGTSPFATALHLKANSDVVPSMIPAEYSETDKVLGTVTTYNHNSLVEAVIKADRNGDGKVDRSEWVKARERQWPYIWLWPAAGALVTCILFVIGFRERVPTAGEEGVGYQAVPEESEP
ncbi:MAG TPA: hypothetical protein VHX68_10465, partial [Planctomycetaceae bacterium]|nr:hypothetical protein [Planctomycetaceae bacterium]